MKNEKDISNRAIKYAFFEEWLKTASEEEIIEGLMLNDERGKLIIELQKQNNELCKMINQLTDKIDEMTKLIKEENERKTYIFTCVKCGFEWESSSEEIMQCGMCGSGNVMIEEAKDD